MWIVVFVTLVACLCAAAAESQATETQLASCRIVTDKLVATANATVTRALKGVCTTEELEKSFMKLKSEINYQMEPMKILILKMEQQLADMHKILIQESGHAQDSVSLKPLWTLSLRGPRDTEVNQHNYTLHTDMSGDQMFSYFWKVEEIASKVSREDQHVAFRSPSFYVNNGYRMYVKLFPHQNKGNIYIHVGLTKGQYDDLLAWPFKLKHRVMLIDQTEQSAEDITSRVWDPLTLCSPQYWQRPVRSKDNEECVGFGFNKTIMSKQHYVYNDCILIKLDVFTP